ncbi:MAG TPA: PAS domain S-box protein, partial [Nitrospirota bacterium]|nr:PAS domain S-box protein [Nitrospirota bacterium]
MNRKREFFHALIQHASDIFTILSIDGTIIYESPSNERTLGYGVNELLGRNVFELVHPEDLQRVRHAFNEVVKHRDLVLSAEFRVLHKDGSWRVLDATGNNQLDNPVITGIVVNSRDVTERRRVEEELRQSEERFRRIFEDSPLGMTILAPNGRLVKVNKAYCEMLRYPEEELVGRSIQEITHPDDKEKSAEVTRQAFEGETSLFHLEKRYVKKNQEILWVEVNATTVQDQEGKVLYCLGMIQDISERKVAEQERVQLISQLMDALAKIKTLKGLIPICAWCKKIRDDSGYWTRVETYIGQHADVSFTHCICPTCLSKVHPATYLDLFGDEKKAQVLQSKREHRNSERLRLRKPVNCAFKVDSGESGKVVIHAILEEIGDRGMCVRTDQPLKDDCLLFSS